tara:strand:- start:531 stop:776 length:246 start_codon:yes stop_codon:yes gene_type:complete
MKKNTTFYRVKHESFYDGYHTKKAVLLHEGELLEPKRPDLGVAASGKRVALLPEYYDEVTLDEKPVIHHDAIWCVDRAFAS